MESFLGHAVLIFDLCCISTGKGQETGGHDDSDSRNTLLCAHIQNGVCVWNIRVLWVALHLGIRIAELMEAPFMPVAIIAVAQWIVRRRALPPIPCRMAPTASRKCREALFAALPGLLHFPDLPLRPERTASSTSADLTEM
jgi:hypothetical protein